MKKLSLFIFLCSIFAPIINFTRCINITTMNNQILYVDDSSTVAELFREYRNGGFCENSRKLVLYFDNYEIIENSQASNYPLWHFGNHVEYATLGYYNSSNYHDVSYSYDYQNRTISIRAPNGMIRTCRSGQTPAHFFRSCRSAGHCSSTAPMTLKFGNYEIKENTPAANKCFYEFNTDATYAYVMYWNNDDIIDEQEALNAIALLGSAICGTGFIYFLTLLNK